MYFYYSCSCTACTTHSNVIQIITANNSYKLNSHKRLLPIFLWYRRISVVYCCILLLLLFKRAFTLTRPPSKWSGPFDWQSERSENSWSSSLINTRRIKTHSTFRSIINTARHGFATYLCFSLVKPCGDAQTHRSIFPPAPLHFWPHSAQMTKCSLVKSVLSLRNTWASGDKTEPCSFL